jgi:hypothetical protein
VPPWLYKRYSQVRTGDTTAPETSTGSPSVASSRPKSPAGSIPCAAQLCCRWSLPTWHAQKETIRSGIQDVDEHEDIGKTYRVYSIISNTLSTGGETRAQHCHSTATAGRTTAFQIRRAECLPVNPRDSATLPRRFPSYHPSTLCPKRFNRNLKQCKVA